MRMRWVVLAMSWAILFAGSAFAADLMMHSGNVTKLDKASGAIEIQNTHGQPEKFSVTDKDILASRVWKKDLNVGDGVDIKTDGNKVVTVLRRNLPVTIRPAEAAETKK